MKKVEISRNGQASTELGYVLIDERGRIWSDMFFPTEEGAVHTSAVGGDGRFVVKLARRIRYIDRPYGPASAGTPRETIIVDD